MKIFFWGLFFFIPALLYAQSYNVSLIPDSLKKDANVVVRVDERILEIKSPATATVRERHVYTVLNESGSKFGSYTSYYDKFTSINNMSGTLYDATGKELKHVKKKDMQDVSGNDEMNLMEDTRYKVNDFYYRSYPYTVLYEEDDEINGIVDFSDWMPISTSEMAVQNSRYVIIAPKDYKIRYKQLNCSIQPVITETGDKKTYTWEAKNLPAVSKESLAPSWREIVPCVLFAPSDFEAEGYKGNMSTWKEYGKFIFQLTRGRDILPENIKTKVHALTDRLTGDRQKVYALYDFLQKNTRYISIQLGIGGWQPFDASYVATKRYGDCKALSNYMVALLKEAGINAKYVEIFAGKNAPAMVEDFPSFQSNHVIACVPLNKDTIWLECTSQTQSPGFMGSFTGDRKAILIDEEGGHVVNTPSYSASDNLQLRVVDAVIDADGNLDANVTTRFTGIQQETPHALIHEVSKDWRDKYLNRVINLPTYQVDKSNFEEEKGVLPAVKEYLHVTSPGYANVTGKRLFVAPNLFNKTSTKFSSDSVRKYDILYDNAFLDIDSVTIKIPEGYMPEAIPQNIKVEGRFGKYAVNLKVEGDRIYYTRLSEKSRGRFPAKDYSELVKFQELIYKSDRSKIVLVKKVE
jgi:transglutaminase-like putative cysteine protease